MQCRGYRAHNRFHQLPRVIARYLRTESFTAHEVAQTLYIGRKPHRQQIKRIKTVLFKYAKAGYLRPGHDVQKRVRFWTQPCAVLTDEQTEWRERLEQEFDEKQIWSDEFEMQFMDDYIDRHLCPKPLFWQGSTFDYFRPTIVISQRRRRRKRTPQANSE
jgi:hypothetical protein